MTTVNRENLAELLSATGSSRPLTREEVDLERLICRIAKRIRRRRRKEARGTTRHPPASEPQHHALLAVAADAQPHDSMRRLRRCYGCGRRFSRHHFWYRRLCPECAELNWEKRHRRGDLRGRRALVTGGRIKVGYQTALMFLRDGAEVYVTSRFPRDAAIRYASEHDHAEWCGRLRILRADFRDVAGLLAVIARLSATLDSLDILVNNAAQTIQMPPGYYARHEALEAAPMTLAATTQACLVDTSPRVAGLLEFLAVAPRGAGVGQDVCGPPEDLLDEHGEPLDPREHTSWTLSLADVSPRELLEVLLVNAAAPYLLMAGLKPLMLRSSASDRYVINVTGLDGRFAKRSKSPRHPHVNATKAAVNMLTRTSAKDFANDGIAMHSVDVGWITQLGSHRVRARLELLGVRPPLDDVDGAARIYDPILNGMAGDQRYGILWRNFQPAAW